MKSPKLQLIGTLIWTHTSKFNNVRKSCACIVLDHHGSQVSKNTVRREDNHRNEQTNNTQNSMLTGLREGCSGLL